jgi:hypothetical protein
MCDYSLRAVKTQDANVGDKLVVSNFGTGTRGFAIEGGDCGTAVCLKPGTELVFEAPVTTAAFFDAPKIDSLSPADQLTAIFRQVNKENENTHHDTIEFANGTKLLLTMFGEGTRATVLQLPAAPVTEAERQEQERVIVRELEPMHGI